jgi:hypothetical protein
MKQRVSIIEQSQLRGTRMHADYESQWRGPQLAFNLGWFHCTMTRPAIAPVNILLWFAGRQ